MHVFSWAMKVRNPFDIDLSCKIQTAENSAKPHAAHMLPFSNHFYAHSAHTFEVVVRAINWTTETASAGTKWKMRQAKILISIIFVDKGHTRTRHIRLAASRYMKWQLCCSHEQWRETKQGVFSLRQKKKCIIFFLVVVATVRSYGCVLYVHVYLCAACLFDLKGSLRARAFKFTIT